MEEIYSFEAIAEREAGKNKCVAVYLDSGIVDKLHEYAHRRKHDDIYEVVRFTIYKYLGMLVEAGDPLPSPYVDSIKLGPVKGRVQVKKVMTCKSR